MNSQKQLYQSNHTAKVPNNRLMLTDALRENVRQEGHAQDTKAMATAYDTDPKKSEYSMLSPGDGR